MLSETDISSEHNSGGLFLDSSEPEGQIVTSLYGAFHFFAIQCAAHDLVCQPHLGACDKCSSVTHPRPTKSDSAL